MDKPSSGFVYFIQAGGSTGPVKIGWAADPKARLGELQVGNHEPLVLIGTVAVERDHEFALHEQFAAQRIRGEWFRWSIEIAIASRGGDGEDLTIAEASKLTGIRGATLFRLMRTGKTEGYVAGTELRLRTRSLDAYMVKEGGAGIIVAPAPA